MRYRRNSFLIEGKKNTLEALEANWDITQIYFTDKAQGKYLSDILESSENQNIAIHKTYSDDLEQVSTLVNPDGVIAVGKIEQKQEKSTATGTKMLFLDRIRDPGNLGTVLRSALWFGLDRVFLSKGSVDPFNPKVVRGSMGSLFYLDFDRNVNLSELEQYRNKNDLEILAGDLSGDPTNEIEDLPSDFILCMGNESHGLRDNILEFADRIISIPKVGTGESLNLAVSSGILMKDLMV